jgi:hypothetical protein
VYREESTTVDAGDPPVLVLESSESTTVDGLSPQPWTELVSTFSTPESTDVDTNIRTSLNNKKNNAASPRKLNLSKIAKPIPTDADLEAMKRREIDRVLAHQEARDAS